MEVSQESCYWITVVQVLVQRLVQVADRAETGRSTQHGRIQGELYGGGVTSADQIENEFQGQVQYDQRNMWLIWIAACWVASPYASDEYMPSSETNYQMSSLCRLQFSSLALCLSLSLDDKLSRSPASPPLPWQLFQGSQDLICISSFTSVILASFGTCKSQSGALCWCLL